MNIRFEYLYRDAGNFKNWGEIVFANKNNHAVDWLLQQARRILIDGEFFIADKASIPNLYFHDHIESLDHGWHEFHSFEMSPATENDTLARDIEDFIYSLKCASKI